MGPTEMGDTAGMRGPGQAQRSSQSTKEGKATTACQSILLHPYACCVPDTCPQTGIYTCKCQTSVYVHKSMCKKGNIYRMHKLCTCESNMYILCTCPHGGSSVYVCLLRICICLHGGSSVYVYLLRVRICNVHPVRAQDNSYVCSWSSFTHCTPTEPSVFFLAFSTKPKTAINDQSQGSAV